MITLQSGDLSRFNRVFSIALVILLTIFSNPSFAQASQNNNSLLQSSNHTETDGSTQVFIPFVQKIPQTLPTINIPYFEGSDVNYHQAAVSWFGRVRGNENYADIRVGYNSTEIYVRLSVVDRFIWFDTSPDIYHLTDWDAVSLYVNLNGNTGYELSPTMFRFSAQLATKTNLTNRQIVYQANSSGWNPVPLTFYTSSGWMGSPNDGNEDRGYILTFHIPFASLGYNNVPAAGTKWGVALTLHDRDDASGSTLNDKFWVQGFDSSSPATWGEFSFGLPDYNPPESTNPQMYTIRNGLGGVVVNDGLVGGSTVCGRGLNFWWQWGDYIYPATTEMNVQNQGNIDDWPCYSKFYITFPLNSLPTGKALISATLTMHQSGQSTGFAWDPPEARNSLIQVSLVDQDWYDSTLSWNGAPVPIENVGQSWVGPITMQEWGKTYSWDLSGAVAKAYAEGKPLRLVVYSADNYGPNGKYILSSQASDDVRPTLSITLGTP